MFYKIIFVQNLVIKFYYYRKNKWDGLSWEKDMVKIIEFKDFQ